ncbi:MAG: SIMPL domain-containing protein [Halorientalis sp.]
MRRGTIAVAAVVVAVVGAGTAGAVLASNADSTATQPAGQTIAVSGEGSASATPDRAVVRVAVVVEGSDPAAVRNRLESDASDLRAALDEAGVPDDAVTTAEYSIQGTPPHREAGDRPAYRGVHAFEVELDDTGRAGAVVDAAASAGAEVQSLRFTLAEDTREQLRDEALTSAMADARRQAETLASAGDLQVTGVASIDATAGEVQPIAFDAAATQAGGGTAIETGDVSVSATVRVVYNATG